MKKKKYTASLDSVAFLNTKKELHHLPKFNLSFDVETTLDIKSQLKLDSMELDNKPHVVVGLLGDSSMRLEQLKMIEHLRSSNAFHVSVLSEDKVVLSEPDLKAITAQVNKKKFK